MLVAQGATGLDAMRAAGHDVRLDGGFVCGIDGLPATGCGNRPDSGYAYWRYWHAAPGGAWSYSQVGAGGYRLPARCAVEGWVWSESPSSNTPPRIAAPTPTCEAPAVTLPPTTAVPSTGPTAAPPAVPGATPGSSVDGGAAAGGAPPAPGTSASTSGAAGAPTSSSVPPAVAGATTVAPSDDTEEDPDGSSSVGDRVDAGASDTPAEDTDGELAVGAASGRSSTTPWGAVVAVVLIALIAGAATLRSRSRPTGE